MNPPSTQNLMKTIVIMYSDKGNGNLTFDLNPETDVNLKEVITWIVHPGSGVKSITEIEAKTGQPNVFSPSGAPTALDGNSKIWQGTIKGDLTKYTESDYNIVWKDENNNEYTYDPKLKVNI